VDELEKKRLIKKYKDEGQSIEGLDSCLHGEMLYNKCYGCGRLVEDEK